MQTTAPASIALAAMLAAGTAAAAVGRDTLAGEPLPQGTPVDRIVRIDQNTPWVNAAGGESLKFMLGDRELSWRLPDNRWAINLKEIAPAGSIDRDLYIYLQANPLYESGS
jgi:hypothetical protein